MRGSIIERDGRRYLRLLWGTERIEVHLGTTGFECRLAGSPCAAAEINLADVIIPDDAALLCTAAALAHAPATADEPMLRDAAALMEAWVTLRLSVQLRAQLAA
ncbi:MAG TPA: hypothetical protein VFL98_01205 [Candidatus Paceibacterota bacterium]|nr:hypothetical protein [Candidatus Paceibacterota bacterium]